MKFVKRIISNFSESFKLNKVSTILLAITYLFISLTLITLPTFTYNQHGLTTITNVLSIISIVCIICYLVSLRKIKINNYVIFIILFLIYSLILTLLTTRDVVFTKTLISTHLFSIALVLFFSNTKSLKIFFNLIFVGIILFALCFIIYYLPTIISNFNNIGRIGSDFGSVNNVGATFGFGTIFCFYYILKKRNKFYFYLIPLLLFIFCIVCTGSRGAYISFFASAIVFLYLLFGRKNIIEFILSLIICVCLVILLLQLPGLSDLKARFILMFKSLFSSEDIAKPDGSTIIRLNMLKDGLSLWTRNLFFGYGVAGFKANTAYSYYSHNTISESLVNFGLIGTSLLMYPIIKSIIISFKNKKQNEFYPFITIMFLTAIPNLFFDILFYNKIVIIIFAFIYTYAFSISEENRFFITLSFEKNIRHLISFEVHKGHAQRKDNSKIVEPNIVFVLTSLSGGGAEKVASILCSEWAKKYRVSLLLTSVEKNPKSNYLIGKNVNLIYISKDKKINPLLKIIRIRKNVKNISPNICVTFLASSFLLAKVATFGLKVFNFFSIRIDPNASTNNNFIKKVAYRMSNVIVCQTNEIEKYFIDRKYKKTIVIQNPINSEITPIDKELNYKLISVGRLTSQKNFGFLIKSFSILVKKNNALHLSIFGSGEDYEELQKLIVDLNCIDNVSIHQFMPDISKHYVDSSIYCSSSLFEGMSNSMIEAALYGLPIVSLDCGGGCAKEIVKNEVNGLVLPLNSTEKEFSDAILKVINNFDQYKQNAVNESFNIKSKMDSTKIAQEWCDLFLYFLN